uniref:CSON014454 protein n=1 Tax=Culicoides sonorensis TaxID=179676 RepID=A0A336MBM4_CULSO
MDRKLRQFHKRKQNPPKPVEKKQRLRMMHAELSIEEQIQLAANNKLYTNRNPEKGIRVITVLLYFLSISLAAIILSCYYVYFWHPEYKNTTVIRSVNCEIVKEISLRTVNATELFYNRLLQKLRHEEAKRWHNKRHKHRLMRQKEGSDEMTKFSISTEFEEPDIEYKSEEIDLKTDDFELDARNFSENSNH